MPADFELRPETRTVHSRGWGALTDAGLVAHMARISALFKAGSLESDWAQLWTSAPSTTSTAYRPPASGSLPKAIPGRASPSAPAS